MDKDNSQITQKKTGRKKDNIRSFFIVKNNLLYCNIDNCKSTFSINSSTSSLRYHVYQNHVKIVDNNINDNIIPMNKKNNKKSLNSCTAIAFAKNSLPHSLIENNYFRDLIEAFKENPNVIINAETLRESIITEAIKINNSIINNLSSSKQPITIAIDGWTNVRSNKVTNILLINNTKSYYYCGIENKEGKNNAPWLTEKLETKIIELIDKNLNVIAITTDNEPLMIAVCKKIIEKFPVIIHVPCAAHIIQLCLKKFFEINKIKIMGDKINNIIYSINENKINKVKLNDLQIADNIINPLTLLYYAPTRWSSIIISIKRIIDLEKYIKIIINEYDEQFWIELKMLHNYLKPIQEYTNIIQKDNASLYCVWNMFTNLITFYESDDIPVIFKEESKISVGIINSYWKKYIDNDLIEIIKLFCFNKNIKITKKQNDYILNWGSLYIQKYILMEETKPLKVIKKTISVQIGKFLSKQDIFSNIDAIIENIKETEKDNDNITYISKIVWGNLMVDNYELSNIAIALLSIYPTESCVERSFSSLSDIHSLERNRLNNDIIDAEMIIKFNI